MSSQAPRRPRATLTFLLMALLPLIIYYDGSFEQPQILLARDLLRASAPRATIAADATRTPTLVTGDKIHDDTFARGWAERWSWSTSLTPAATSPVYNGATSYGVRYTSKWGGFRLMHSGDSWAGFGELRFALHGGTTGGQKIKISVTTSVGKSITLGRATAVANQWTVVRLTLPSTVTSATISELVWQEDAGVTTKELFIDMVELGRSTPPPPAARHEASRRAPTPTSTRQPIPATLKIMPLGDSITEGVNGGYRVGLWNSLIAAGYTVDYVGPRNDPYATIPDKDHAGTPGFNTGNILSNINSYITTYQPDIVLLMIGTNDIAWWTADTNVAGSTAENVGEIIDRIEALKPGTRVILATTPPISSNVIQIVNLDRAVLIRQYNVALRQLAAQRGITLVDVEAALTLADLYDGVHPGYEAHITKIAPLWAAAIMQ